MYCRCFAQLPCLFAHAAISHSWQIFPWKGLSWEGAVASGIASSADRTSMFAPRLDGVSARLNFDGCDAALDVAGLYISRTNTQSLMMEVLHGVHGGRDNQTGKDLIPFITGGDHNTTNLDALYEEWTQAQGMVDSVDPKIATFASGTPFDKILFMPGRNIPSTFLPTRGAEWPEEVHRMDNRYYPASVLDCTHLSDNPPGHPPHSV